MSVLLRPAPSRAAARRRRHARYRRLVLALALAVCALGAFFALASGAREPVVAVVPCLNKSDHALRTTLTDVARRIYLNEQTRYGSVLAAVNSVVDDHALAQALRQDNPTRTQAAVIALVYNHHHIVRLRVTRTNKVLADVGGQWVLAPLTGPIRDRGTTIGHYMLSVQDDLGYELLTAREAGLKVVMSAQGHRILTDLVDAPARIPAVGTLTLDGTSYVTNTLTATSFPDTPLQINVLAPKPAQPFGSLSCQQIKADALTNVAAHIATRAQLRAPGYTTFIHLVNSLTQATVLVTQAGLRAGGSARAPLQPPTGTGPVLLHGSSYNFSSFTTFAQNGVQLRVYVFVR